MSGEKPPLSYKDNPLFEKLLTLNLPPEDFAVFGSGAMAPYGLKDFSKDVDVIARGKAWEKAKELGTPEQTRMQFGEVVSLFDGTVEIYNGWPPAGMWDIEKLIDGATVIDGIKFVSLKDVIAWKKDRKREGDAEDIAKIEKYLQETG